MLRAIARLLILRILPRRLVPILTLYEAYRIYRALRRRQHREAVELGARRVNRRGYPDRAVSDPERRSAWRY
jgi:hypothetical protein